MADDRVRDRGTYRVRYWRDTGDDAWLADVPEVRGCHTYGRTLEEARRNLREALGLFIDDADGARLVELIRMPVGLKRNVQRARGARDRAARANVDAQTALRGAALRITRAGLSLRDAGELLGISRQRVQQLLTTRAPTRAPRPRRARPRRRAS